MAICGAEKLGPCQEVFMDSSHDDGRDCRGWAMRRGHCKRFERECQGDRPGRGRACFARSVKERPRSGPNTRASQRKRGDAGQDMRWLLCEDTGVCDDYACDEKSRTGCAKVEPYFEDTWPPDDAHGDASVRSWSEESRKDVHAFRCWLCTTEESSLPLSACPFCADLRHDFSLWERAVAKADEVAAQLGWLKQNGQAHKHIKQTEPAFEQLRQKFLAVHGRHIRGALAEVLGNETRLEPAPLSGEVQSRFMAACGQSQPKSLPANLVLAFHGTRASNHASIFASGLLVPSDSSGVRVANGSVYGVGIYTTVGSSIATSRCYCSEPRMLVCGILHNANPIVMSTHDWGRVVFDDRRIVPFFEAFGAGELVHRRGPNAGNSGNVPFQASNGAIRLIAARATSAPRREPLLSRVARVVVESTRRFLTRRAARKRSLRKSSSVQSR